MAVIADLEGVLESCGCSGPVTGIDRIVHALNELRASGDEIVVVMAGNLLFPHRMAPGSEVERAQEQIKAETLGVVLTKLRPTIIAPGPADLQRGAPILRDMQRRGVWMMADPSARLEGKTGSSKLPGRDRESPLGFIRVEAGARASSASVERLRAEGAKVIVAFAQGDDTTQAEFAGVDLVIHTSSGRAEVVLDGGTLHLYPGRHSEELWLLRLWPSVEHDGRWRLAMSRPSHRGESMAVVERRRLEASVPSDPEIRPLLEQAFARVHAISLSDGHREMSLADPGSIDGAHTYVGSGNCAPCHVGAYRWWTQNPHGRAFATLERRGRSLDLACIGCHVTGFGRPGGASLGRLAGLQDVGCESCHGPGARHIQDPRAQTRSIERVPAGSVCTGCHDEAHSAGFDDEQGRKALRGRGHAEAIIR